MGYTVLSDILGATAETRPGALRGELVRLANKRTEIDEPINGSPRRQFY